MIITPRPLLVFTALLTAASTAELSAQVAPAAPGTGAKSEAVMLSPFEVSSAKDTGYLASQTLSGTRLNTNIEDTGVAETIITPDFMRDLGLTSLDEVFKFVPNTGTDDPQLGTSAGNNQLFSSVAYTSRGFSVASAQRDFLPTTAPADIYNTERISFTRGPNAILYGLGNPGGISNAVSQRANLNRNTYEVDLKVDSNSGLRTSFNANLPLMKGRLGLRLARLDDDRGSHLKPDENLHRRTYAALRFQPWTKTIIDVNYEDGDQRRRALARGFTYSDGFSGWTTLPAASRPRVTTAGSVLANTTIAGLDQLIAANTIFIVDGATPAIAPMNWARMGKTRVATPALGGIHGVTEHESFSLPFPVETNLMGYSDGTQVDFRALTASWQQNILPSLDFELTYNRQFSDRFADYSKPAATDTLLVDPNVVLPNGASNPNYGKYYYDAGAGGGVIFFQKNSIELARATVSYEIDAKKHVPRFGRWLGRHRFAGLVEQQKNPFSGVNNATFRNLTPTKTSVPGLAATWAAGPGAASNLMQYRYYFDPAAGVNYMPSMWDKYPRLASSDNIAALQATLTPDGNGVTPGFANGGPPVLRYTRVDTKIFATHNYWLDERVITLFGWRKDERTQYSRTLPLDPVSVLYPDPVPYNARDGVNTRTVQPANTFSKGVVLVATSWLRLFYNESSSLVLQDPAASDLYSNPIDNAKGRGTETGLRVALFKGRVQASFSRWETDMQGQAVATIRNQLGLFNFTNATNTLWNTAAALSGDNKYLQPPYRPAQNFTDYQDYVARGYEFSLTANPTANWRLTLNGGQQSNQQSNIGPVLKKYWAEYEQVWRTFPNRDLNGNGVIDATLPATLQAQIEKFADRTGGSEAATIGQLIDAYGAGVGRIVASSGVSTTSIPKWSGNVVTNYRFSEGLLKNIGVGGSLNYRGPRRIGFLLTNEGLYRPNAAIMGAATWDTGLWVSYARTIKLTAARAVRWRVQLNVRNVIDNRDLEPITGLDDGAGNGVTVRWRVPEPRTFVLSNTLDF